MWNSDNESLAGSEAGQPRGDCPYPNNLDFCRGYATGQSLDLDDRRNSIHATSVIKIGFLKADRRWAFKKPILVFPAPLALEIPKSVS